MAIARPVRALGLVAIVLWCFFVWQIFKPTAPLKIPDNIPPNEQDPNLERKELEFFCAGDIAD